MVKGVKGNKEEKKEKEEKEAKKEEKKKENCCGWTDGIEGSIRGPRVPKKLQYRFLSSIPSPKSPGGELNMI